MDSLPDDILFDIGQRQVDIWSILSLAATSTRFKRVFNAPQLVQPVTLPTSGTRLTLCIRNIDVERSIRYSNKHLCIYCQFCGVITPVQLAAIQVEHRCTPTFSLVRCTNRYNIIYGGSTQHLAVPEPCDPCMFHDYNLSVPLTHPYAHTLA